MSFLWADDSLTLSNHNSVERFACRLGDVGQRPYRVGEKTYLWNMIHCATATIAS